MLGVKFPPLNVPIHRGLQTIVGGTTIITAALVTLFGALLLVYLIFFTSYWPIALLYSVWIYTLDKDICDRGGRRTEWVRNWTFWKYLADYFPLHLKQLHNVELDPKRNYLFCCFPHGILPFGASLAFGTNCSGFQKLFSHHTPHLLTLKQLYLFPILRELLLALGGCSASRNSLNWILGHSGGGKLAVLMVGGAAEALYSKPRQYQIVLKNRKGFVKLALENGSPLVPVFSFGETDIFDQVDNPDGSVLRHFQEWIKSLTGFVPVLPLGRGFFRYSFGIMPIRRPIFTIIGKPIEVPKVKQPTGEQIDKLHEEFSKRLIGLFEEQKWYYLADPQKATLVIS